MTLATWPEGLPLPERDNYGYSLPELNQRSSFSLGGRVRPLFSDGPDSFSASVDLGADEWRLIQAWFRYDIANGADWFSIDLLASGRIEPREVRFISPPSFQLIGPVDVRVSLRLETRTGTTISREEYEDILDGIGFSDYVKTLLIPSDTAILKPITGDAAPTVPIPWLGLYLPFGARVSLEGADGIVAPLDLPPETVFTGMVPRKLLARGTDADAVVYGLSHPSVTSLPDYAGDRALPILLSDTANLHTPAIGGIYSAAGGSFSYATAAGSGTATIAPRTWLADRAAVITRVNAAGTDAGFAALAFVRSLSIPLSPLTFGDGGESLLFTPDGSTLVFGS